MLVRSGFVSGQIMVVIVTAEGEFPSERSFVNALTSRFPEIKSIVHNVSVDELELTLGEKSRTLYGNGFIEERLCGLDFRISPRSFYQVNPVQTEILYAKAKELALLGEEGKIGRLIDAYCGTGTIGLTMADSCESVIGVELNGDAVCDAEKNAELNGVGDRLGFLVGNVLYSDFMEDLGSFDCILSNPPYIETKQIPLLDEELAFEPEAALDGGDDGLDFYRVIIGEYGKYLTEGGIMLLEIGCDQAKDISSIASSAGMRCEIFKDYGGNDRVAVIK